MHIASGVKVFSIWALWLVVFCFLLIAAVFVLTAVFGTVTRATTSELFSVPGKLVNIGNHKLHLDCTGDGPHTIVLESGGGSWSHDWSIVQKELSRFSRVCSYDRAGFGWSESAAGDRDFTTIVNELNKLLINGEVEAPYVLVGASLGGAIVQMYAEKFPDKVSGVLLLDARAKRSVTDMLALEPSLLPSVIVPKVAKQLSAINLVHGILGITGTERLLSQGHPGFGSYPKNVKDIYLNSNVLANNLTATFAEAIVDAQSEDQLDVVRDLGDIPLLVVIHGYENRFDGLSLSSEKRSEIENEWQRQQVEMSKLSTNGKLVIAENSGHLIQLDQPRLVVKYVEELLDTIVRGGRDNG